MKLLIWFKRFFYLLFLVVIALLVYSQVLILGYGDRVYYNLEEVNTTSVAIVFGAGLKRDGSLSDALYDRVLSGIELYRAGKVDKLLMTGDNGTRYHNEVTPMKEMAVEEGIPEEDVVLDYAGFRTYDSCYRARDIFGVKEAIVVSQDFHLPRIIYICNRMGLKVWGYASDRREYMDEGIWAVREMLARLKAWYQVEYSKPLPKLLGEKEYIF